MAKVRTGKIGIGSYTAPSGQSIFGKRVQDKKKKIGFKYDYNKLSPAQNKEIAQARKIDEEKRNIEAIRWKYGLPNSYGQKSAQGRRYSLKEYSDLYSEFSMLLKNDGFIKKLLEDKEVSKNLLQLVKNRILANQTDADDKLIKGPTDKSVISTYKNRQLDEIFEHRYNLYDSGEFFRTLKVEYIDGKITVVSTSFKRQAIINAYGENAYQLSNKEIAEFMKFYDSAVQEYLDAMAYNFEFKL